MPPQRDRIGREVKKWGALGREVLTIGLLVGAIPTPRSNRIK